MNFFEGFSFSTLHSCRRDTTQILIESHIYIYIYIYLAFFGRV